MARSQNIEGLEPLAGGAPLIVVDRIDSPTEHKQALARYAALSARQASIAINSESKKLESQIADYPMRRYGGRDDSSAQTFPSG